MSGTKKIANTQTTGQIEALPLTEQALKKAKLQLIELIEEIIPERKLPS